MSVPLGFGVPLSFVCGTIVDGTEKLREICIQKVFQGLGDLHVVLMVEGRLQDADAVPCPEVDH
jgi:hypothetical protein